MQNPLQQQQQQQMRPSNHPYPASHPSHLDQQQPQQPHEQHRQFPHLLEQYLHRQLQQEQRERLSQGVPPPNSQSVPIAGARVSQSMDGSGSSQSSVVNPRNSPPNSWSEEERAAPKSMVSHSPERVLQANQDAQLYPSNEPPPDDYSWRKYGQKVARGAIHPRKYYRCAVSNCPAKKTVELSNDGKQTDIVYKEEHNHPKPLYSASSISVGVEQIRPRTEPLNPQIQGAAHRQSGFPNGSGATLNCSLSNSPAKTPTKLPEKDIHMLMKIAEGKKKQLEAASPAQGAPAPTQLNLNLPSFNNEAVCDRKGKENSAAPCVSGESSTTTTTMMNVKSVQDDAIPPTEVECCNNKRPKLERVNAGPLSTINKLELMMRSLSMKRKEPAKDREKELQVNHVEQEVVDAPQTEHDTQASIFEPNSDASQEIGYCFDHSQIHNLLENLVESDAVGPGFPQDFFHSTCIESESVEPWSESSLADFWNNIRSNPNVLGSMSGYFLHDPLESDIQQ